MSAATPIAKAINPQRFIQTESGGFVDIGVIYLGADGAVEVLEWSKDLGRANFIDAQAVCAGAGEGYRAPSPHEFVGIVNYDKEMPATDAPGIERSEEHTSELQSLMRISYAVFCLKKKKTK